MKSSMKIVDDIAWRELELDSGRRIRFMAGPLDVEANTTSMIQRETGHPMCTFEGWPASWSDGDEDDIKATMRMFQHAPEMLETLAAVYEFLSGLDTDRFRFRGDWLMANHLSVEIGSVLTRVSDGRKDNASLICMIDPLLDEISGWNSNKVQMNEQEKA